MTAPGDQRATVIAANVNRAARVEGRLHHYDMVLDVIGSDGVVIRHELVDVSMGTMLPTVGSMVHVHVGSDGSVEISWRGDPNLDLDAHRAQLAQLAERAKARRPDPDRE